MESYSYMSDAGLEAIVNNLPTQYPMSLNKTDMINLLWILKKSWEADNEWAGDFVSCIATTLDIEFI